MSKPTVFMVCEGLQAPPSAGFHIHLLSLARALAEHVNVRAYAWLRELESPEWANWVASLPPGSDPSQYLRPIRAGERSGNAVLRKVSCWRAAQADIANCAQDGDVLWMREMPTAIWSLAPWSRLLPRRHRLRHLYDVASLVELEVGLSRSEHWHSQKSLIERLIRPRFDIVRTLGPAMANQLVESGVPRSKILIAPVGADPPTSPRPQPSRLRRLLYVGSADRWQGLPTLLEAMDILATEGSQTQLTVVGASSDQVTWTSTMQNVHFEGWVARSRMPEVYENHDLFIIPRPDLPLTRVVIPMKSVEALVQQIPILASDLPAIREVAGDDGAAYFSPGSASALAQAVLDLEREPSTLATIQTAAAKRSPAYHWSTIASDLISKLFPDGA